MRTEIYIEHSAPSSEGADFEFDIKCGQPQGLSLRVVGIFHSVRSTYFFSLFTLHSSLPDRAFAIPYAIPYSIKILGGFAEGGNGVCIRSVYTHLKMQMHSVRRLNRNY